MVIHLPCEVTIWYVMPAVRREIVTYLAKDGKLPRKKIAEALDLTPAAVSQYLNGKRGNNFDFDNFTVKKIHDLADRLAKEPENAEKIFIEDACNICTHIRKNDDGKSYPKDSKCPEGKETVTWIKK